jgi:pyruvate,water dikinase
MRARIWELHFIAIEPSVDAANRFLDLCEELLGSATNEYLSMLQGFSNKTIATAEAIFQVHNACESFPELQNMSEAEFLQHINGSLDLSSVAKPFLSVLEQYGLQGTSMDIGKPCWQEDPRLLVQLIRSLESGQNISPKFYSRRAARRRRKLTRAALDGLKESPRLGEFRQLLKEAQQCPAILEDHRFYMDEMNTALLRLPFLELGGRMVAMNMLERQDQVFYLTFEELQTIEDSRNSSHLLRLVHMRETELADAAQKLPSRVIARDNSSLESDRQTQRFFGKVSNDHADEDRLVGRSASLGIRTGTACILTSLEELGKLEAGEILVCTTTDPAWSTIFSKVAAVVTDTGGELSHSAILAREYGLPCVVGTTWATQKIRDGQRICVDGGRGIVYLLD